MRLAAAARLRLRLVRRAMTFSAIARPLLIAAFTLLPGDVILTGTPAGVGPIVDGDDVTVAVEGIGELTNRVVAA